MQQAFLHQLQCIRPSFIPWRMAGNLLATSMELASLTNWFADFLPFYKIWLHAIIRRTPRAWCTPGKNVYFWQIIRKDLRTRLHDSTISVREYSLELLPKLEFRIYIPPVLLHPSGKEPLSSQRAKSSMEIESPQFSTGRFTNVGRLFSLTRYSSFLHQ